MLVGDSVSFDLGTARRNLLVKQAEGVVNMLQCNIDLWLPNLMRQLPFRSESEHVTYIESPSLDFGYMVFLCAEAGGRQRTQHRRACRCPTALFGRRGLRPVSYQRKCPSEQRGESSLRKGAAPV